MEKFKVEKIEHDRGTTYSEFWFFVTDKEGRENCHSESFLRANNDYEEIDEEDLENAAILLAGTLTNCTHCRNCVDCSGCKFCANCANRENYEEIKGGKK